MKIVYFIKRIKYKSSQVKWVGVVDLENVFLTGISEGWKNVGLYVTK